MAKNSNGIQGWVDDVVSFNKRNNTAKKNASKASTTRKETRPVDSEDDWSWNSKPTTIKRTAKKSKKLVVKPKVKSIDYKVKYMKLRKECSKLAKSLGKLAKELKALR